jgi:Domain of unknown function (DUF4062)
LDLAKIGNKMNDKKPLRCFLSTPFSGFIEVRQAIAEALRRVGVQPLLVEDLKAEARSVVEVLQDQIQNADFIIADVTGGNPNVLYEVGFAHALKKPVLPIVQKIDSAPPAIVHSYLLFIYDVNDLSRLENAVMSWAARFISESERSKA